MTILGLLVFGIPIALGIIMGIRRRAEIEALRPPKNHWRQGHKLRYATPAELSARESEAILMERKAARLLSSGHQLDENDLAEMDGMFGRDGTNPSDYD